MTRIVATLVFLPILVTCEDPAPTCAELQDTFEYLVATADKSCVTADDCTFVGGTFAGTCNCTPLLGGDCGGRPVRDTPANLAPFQDVVREVEARCLDELPLGCDCAPSERVCRDGRCSSQDGSCF